MPSSQMVQKTTRFILTILVLITISACQSSDTASTSQSLTFSASSTSINVGEFVTLSWSASTADSCAASGDWSGSKAISGQETVGPLQANSTFTLSCRTPSTTLVETISINVASAPMLSFMADRTSINAGESVILFWATESVDSCTAFGAWTGSRAVNGQETVGPIQADSTYTMRCNTGSNTLIETVNVVVMTTGGNLNLEGTVDSSFVDGEAFNKVYIFSGNVPADDYDGDSGDPVATATVTQDPGACTWRYGLASGLADGQYTVAFTADAGEDNPSTNDVLNFVGSTTINVSGGTAVQNFVPANIVRIGPTRTFTSFAQAAVAVSDGDVVEIDAGIYQDDVSVWRRNNITLRGINGRAHLKAVAIIPFSGGNDQKNGKAILVSQGDNVRFENLEFSGARVPDLNGAGIRPEGGAVSICNNYFHDNENGILGGGTTVLVEYSEFDNNGLGEFGRTHNIYISAADRLIFRNNYSHHANIGHNLKSRARENYVLYNRLMDEVSGTSSYAVDLPNGGLSYLIGNLLQQGPAGDNNFIFRYGAEGLAAGATHRVYVVNNTFVNDRQSGTFVSFVAGTNSASLTNNLFVGNGTVLSGTAQQTTNLQTNSPGLVDMANYDYRLTAGSAARDAGSASGSGDGYSLVPIEHYLPPHSTEPRIQSGQIDIGAYEYSP